MDYSALNPADHAESLIETCQGDAYHAIALAHTNVEFASDDATRDYWDRVSIAIQQRIEANVVPAAFVGENGELLRLVCISTEEMEMSNRLLRAVGCERRWMRL